MPLGQDGQCDICLEKKEARYTCPRCHITYCTLKCFKSPSHQECSEAFYKDQVMLNLKGKRGDDADREEMLRMLRDLEEEDEEEDMNGLMNRLSGIDLDEASFDQMWDCLTEDEKASFDQFAHRDFKEEELGRNEHVESVLDAMVLPWWDARFLGDTKNISDDRGGVVDMDEGEEILQMDYGQKQKEQVLPPPPRPMLVDPLPRYRDLTKAPWNPLVLYYLPSLLFTYAYVGRVLGGDWEEEEEEGSGIKACWTLSPILLGGEKTPPTDLEASLACVIMRLTDQTISCIRGQPPELVNTALEDMERLITSPSLVLAVLSDLYGMLQGYMDRMGIAKKDKGYAKMGGRKVWFLMGAVAVVRSSLRAKEVWFEMVQRVQIIVRKIILERTSLGQERPSSTPKISSSSNEGRIVEIVADE